jgi:hypothetical protein
MHAYKNLIVARSDFAINLCLEWDDYFLHSWECSFCKSNLLCRCMMCYISVFK